MVINYAIRGLGNLLTVTNNTHKRKILIKTVYQHKLFLKNAQ